MNTATAVGTHYPEILKFCEWFKKQQTEEGLNLVGMSLRVPQIKNSSLQSDSESPHLSDIAGLIGKRVYLTPPVIEELIAYIAIPSKTEALDYFEKVCAEFNRAENLIQSGETKPPPGLF